MISRVAKLQVLIFALVSLLGVVYVGVRYVGLGDRLLGRTYLVHADFGVAGGLFSNAAVTYRGVPVGRVGAVRLHGDGVRVDLVVRRDIRIPADLRAVVAQRSAVGEQYVDLRPNADTGPYLHDGDVIPSSRTGTPLAVETLLADASQFLPQTLALIRDGRTVLETQAASADAIRRWAAALAQLANAMRDADADLRRLLAAGPPATTEIVGLLRDLDPSIGPLLGNLITVNGVAVRRLAGIEQILVVFPIVVAGGFTVAPGDSTAHLGLVVNANDPPPCQYIQTGAGQQCTAGERAGGSGVRSSGNAPRPGGSEPAPAPPRPSTGAVTGPEPATGSSPSAGLSVAGYDPARSLVVGPDGLQVMYSGTGEEARLAGDQSWKQLLLAGLAP